MKKVFLVTLATILVVLCAGSMASAGWVDTFDTYANQAAFSSVWSTVPGAYTALTWTNDQSSSPSYSVKTDGVATNQYSHRAIGEEVTYATLNFEFKFYDAKGTTAAGGRSMGQVWSRVGGVWGGSLNQGLGIGRYNNLTTTKYTGRMVNGAVGATSGYFALNGAADRSIGWHTAAIKGNPATGNIEFWIDGLLGGTQSYGARAETFNIITLGMGLSSASVPLYYDDVSINAVPEPGTIVAALALLGPAGMMIRRRRA